MGSEEANKDFPDNDQRFAFCVSQWDRRERAMSEQKFRRAFHIDAASVDAESRSFEASLSSESVGKQFFPGIGIVKERLLHGKENIDLSRASRGLSMLFNHNENVVIGGVTNIRISDDKKLRGRVRFDDDNESEKFFRKVQSGSLKDISVTYEVIDFEETKRGEVDVTKWMPVEASLVPVPMDPNVGIGRTMETKMENEVTESTEATPVESPREEVTLDNLSSIRDRNKRAGTEAGIKLERKRVADIRQAFTPYLTRGAAFEDLYDVCIDKGYKPDRAMKELLDLIGTDGTGEPVAPIQTANRAAVPNGQTSGEKMHEGIVAALARRSYILTDEEKKAGIGQNEFGGLRLQDIARMCAESQGINCRGLTPNQIVGKVMMSRFIDPGTAIQAVADFPAILEDLINKGVGAGWTATPETWREITDVRTAQDFKTISAVKLSNVPQLPVVNENAALTELSLSDATEKGALLTYGGRLSLTRQAIINDDLSMFSDMSVNAGAAASRRVGDLVYSVLTTNGNMTEDGLALFEALTHKNIGTVGPISETTIDEMNVLMGVQQDPGGTTLNYRVARMVVPLELELSARKVASNSLIVDPTGAAAESNVLQGAFGVTADARLSAASATTYYGFNARDTIRVYFLNGREGPTVEMDEGWSTLASHWRVYIDIDAFALDWRTMVRNATA